MSCSGSRPFQAGVTPTVPGSASGGRGTSQLAANQPSLREAGALKRRAQLWELGCQLPPNWRVRRGQKYRATTYRKIASETKPFGDAWETNKAYKASSTASLAQRPALVAGEGGNVFRGPGTNIESKEMKEATIDSTAAAN